MKKEELNKRIIEIIKTKTMKIITRQENPPIPTRNYDWSAITENYDEGDPIGYGRTEQDAINNLKQLLK